MVNRLGFFSAESGAFHSRSQLETAKGTNSSPPNHTLSLIMYPPWGSWDRDPYEDIFAITKKSQFGLAVAESDTRCALTVQIKIDIVANRTRFNLVTSPDVSSHL